MILFRLALATALIASNALASEPILLHGQSNLGEACELRVENISFFDGWENTWEGIKLTVRTDLQSKGASPLIAMRSPTPAVLLGMSPDGREMISLHYPAESLNPADILYMIYQKPGGRSPFQARCVFKAPE